jgi:hypothetical protein
MVTPKVSHDFFTYYVFLDPQGSGKTKKSGGQVLASPKNPF